jgi:hypothetical protein
MCVRLIYASQSPQCSALPVHLISVFRIDWFRLHINGDVTPISIGYEVNDQLAKTEVDRITVSGEQYELRFDPVNITDVDAYRCSVNGVDYDGDGRDDMSVTLDGLYIYHIL